MAKTWVMLPQSLMWSKHSISKFRLAVLVFLSDSWDNFSVQWCVFGFGFLFCFALFTSAYNFQDVFLDFEGKTQLCWDPGNWSFKIKENVMVSGLVHEDTELTIATYYVFLIILQTFFFFWKERVNIQRAECFISFLFWMLQKNSRT